MEITCLIILISMIRVIASALRNRRPAITTIATARRESLCTSCACAHIARGYRERDRMIRCAFAGNPRRIRFVVSTCSMYCNRDATSRIVRIVGFAQPQTTVRVAARTSD